MFEPACTAWALQVDPFEMLVLGVPAVCTYPAAYHKPSRCRAHLQSNAHRLMRMHVLACICEGAGAGAGGLSQVPSACVV